jgi:hypothetical protein
MARFADRPAMFETPFLDLADESDGGFASSLILGCHEEQASAQFIGCASVLAKDVRLLSVRSSLQKGGFELVPHALRKGLAVIDENKACR